MPDLAHQLIARTKENKNKSLNLSHCWLREIPAEVADLHWLENLSVAGETVTDLSVLSGLVELRTLNVSNTHVVDLSPLSGLVRLQELSARRTDVADLQPLSRLVGLQLLNVSGTRVIDLRPLSGLMELQTLDVSNARVVDLSPLSGLVRLQMLFARRMDVADLRPLSGLVELQTLDVSNTLVADLSPLSGSRRLQSFSAPDTRVADLRPLSGLVELQTLDVSNTRVADLSPLSELNGLKRLNVNRTSVADLSPLIRLIRRGGAVIWSSHFLGDGLYVESCPLTNPPPEIARQGNAAVLNYFAERAKEGVDYLYEAKVLIVGEGGAGKTSLLRRLYQPDEELPTESDSTKGIEIHKQEFTLSNGRTFRLNVWDFGGQQIYHATHQFFLTQRSLYVLLDDTRKDYKSVSDEGFRYWLELIDVFGGHSPTLIFQNEKAGRSKAIDFSGIQQRYNNVQQLFAGNLELHNAADKVREGIKYHASQLNHIGEEVPAHWLKVREEVEKLAKKQAYISLEVYFELYAKHIEFEKEKALLLSRYFHDLGVFLHFQDDMLLKRTVILQNEWATEAVFRLLDDEVIKKKRGRFNEDDCSRLWKDSIYARMHPELLALMKNFELCYELRDSVPKTWLAPQLLPPTKPEAVKNWAKTRDLVLRYKYEFLPKGMISRLTVRLHRFVKDSEKAWVTGVLFEHDRTAVLTEILPDGNHIELRAAGPERKELLSVVAADLDALNESFKGLRDKVEKLVPCYCVSCELATTPTFFSQKELLRRKEDDQLMIECGRRYKMVNVIQLLDGIRVEKTSAWANDNSAVGSKPKQNREATRNVSIFLASSSELRKDRDEFELYFRTYNDQLIKKGVYLKVERWEHFDDSVSQTRKQDDYNKVVRDCDVFVCLIFTRAGKFTQEEFDAALGEFKARGKPRIFTFLKAEPVDIESVSEEELRSRLAFKEKLRELGHFYTRYRSIEDLKLQFREQIDRVIEQICD